MNKNNSIRLDVYVNYKGNCRDAFEFYEKHLGGKITMISIFKDLPDPTNIPNGANDDDVLHARIEIGNTALMGADIPNAEPMRSAYLTLTFDSVEETERIYELLSDGGQFFMKMEETFFAKRFAMMRDRFGTNWMLLCER